MTRTKAVSLLLVAVLMLTVAMAALPSIRQPLASVVLPNQGKPAAAMFDNTPVMACAGCSGGGSGGG